MKKGLLLTMATVLLLTGNSYAQELGEFCWSAFDGDCVIRLQVTQHGNYYGLNGRQTCSSDNENSNLYGSAFLEGSTVRMGATKVGRNKLDLTNGYSELDLSTLSGVLYYDTNQSTQMNKITCP